MRIRPETATDYDEITALLDAAFEGTYESALVAALRHSPWYLPLLTLIGEDGGRVVAFVMLSKVGIETGDSNDVAVAVGPLAVTPDSQKRGYGSAIMREALARLDAEQPDELCVLLGHPEYYPRFGFGPASLLGVYPPLPWPDASFMARCGGGCSKRGTIRYPEPWQIDSDRTL